MRATQDTSATAWYLHPLDCDCLKCTTWLKSHGPGCKCGLKSCWEKNAMLIEGDAFDQDLLPA